MLHESRAAYRLQMPIINSPPSSEKFAVDSRATEGVSPFRPRLVLANKMYHLDIALVMPVCRFPLILCVRCAIVGVAQSMPWPMLVILVQQALVGSVKAIPSCCQVLQCPVLSHTRTDDHQASVEAVRPANIRSCREWSFNVEQLIYCSQSNHVCVQIDDFPELSLSPEVDFGEGEEQIATVHEEEVAGIGIDYSFDGYQDVI